MLRKHKIILTALFYIPLAIIIPIGLNLLLQQKMLFITNMNFVFALPCLLFIVLPLGKLKISSTDAKPQYSSWRWVFIILCIELGTMALFICQHYLLTHSILPPNHWDHSTQNKLTISFISNYFNLSSWMMIGCVAICFSYFSKKQSTAPFSTFIPQWPTLFLSHMIKAIVDAYITLATKFFLTINVITLSILIYYLFKNTPTTFSPLDGMLITIIAFFFYFNKQFQKALKLFENREFGLGLNYFIMILMYIAVFWITQFITQWLNTHHHTSASYTHISDIVTLLLDTKTTLLLWEWSWWILAVPLLSSFLIKFSHGRKIRSFLIVILALPLLAILLSVLPINFLENINLFDFANKLIYLTLPFGFLFFSYILLNVNSTWAVWLGFIPVQTPKKIHEKKMIMTRQQIWSLTIALLGFLLMTGPVLIQLILIGITLPCLLIFFGITVTRFVHYRS